MDEQHGTTDGAADQLPEVPGAPATSAGAPEPGVGTTPVFGLPLDGKEFTMQPTPISEEAPAASLVGSLSVFTLADVLSLLAATDQTGELQVVSDVVDGRIWLEDGQFSNAHVGAASTIGQAVFELACVAEGWFYFTAGVTSSSGQPTVPVKAVLDEVRPQVDEWFDLRQIVPLEAVVSLSPTPPGQDIQIRSDQWTVLTTVGNAGHSVKAVIDLIGGDQIAGLRTLHDLQAAGLIVVEPVADDQATVEDAPVGTVDDAPSAGTVALPETVFVDERLGDLAPPPPPTLDQPVTAGSFGNLAEVAIMPPPIAGDPWAAAESNGSVHGSSDHGVA
jgi:hypothetical protein